MEKWVTQSKIIIILALASALIDTAPHKREMHHTGHSYQHVDLGFDDALRAALCEGDKELAEFRNSLLDAGYTIEEAKDFHEG